MTLKKLSMLPAALLVSAAWSSPAQASCTLVVSSPTVDFGVLDRSSAPASGEIPLGKRSVRLTASCSAPSDMTIFNRALAGLGERYALSGDSDYRVLLRDAVLDGSSVDLGEVITLGDVPTATGTSMVLNPNKGLVPTRAGVAVQGEQFQVQVDIDARAKQRALSVRDETHWQADASFDLTAAGEIRAVVVQASVLPVSCVPTLSAGGVVDFGSRSAQGLSASGETKWEARDITLMVNCDAKARFAIRTLDNRSGSATSGAPSSFGLGNDRSGNRIGYYTIQMREFQSGATPSAYVTRSTDGGSTWTPAQTGPVTLSHADWFGWTDLSTGGVGPAALEQTRVTLSIAPTIAPASSLDTSDAVQLQGSATFEVMYL